MKSWHFLLCLASPFLALPLQAMAGTQTLVLTPSADNSLFQDSGDLSNGIGPNLYVGRNQVGLQRRALLRFDLSALPPGAVLIGARLDLVMNRNIADGQTIFLHRVGAAWGEGTSNSGINGGGGADATAGDATWTQRVYPSVPWTALGGEFAATSSASTYAADVGPYSWGPNAALLADVEFWRANPASNFGWLLRADESVPPPSAKRFGSRENAVAAERPRLVITIDGLGPTSPPLAIPALGRQGIAAFFLLAVLAGLFAARRLAKRNG